MYSPWEIAYSPDGAVLAVAHQDGRITLWRTADGGYLRTLIGHPDSVDALAFTPDGTMLASGGDEIDDDTDCIKLWRVADGVCLRTITGVNCFITALAFSPDGQALASGSAPLDNDAGVVELWRVADGARLHRLVGHTGWVCSLAFTRDGAMLASGSQDASIRLWSITEGRHLRTLTAKDHEVLALAFAPDDKTLVSGNRHLNSLGAIKLWRIRDAKCLYTRVKLDSPILAVAFTQDGTGIHTVDSGRTIERWRSADGACLNTCTEPHEGNNILDQAAFSPDGNTVATLDWVHRAIALRRVSDGARRLTISEQVGAVWSLSCSRDGKVLAAASEGAFTLWDLAQRTCLATITGEKIDADTGTMDANGQVLVSRGGMKDNDARLITVWRAADGALLHTIRVNDGILGLALAPDGKLFASGSRDATTKIWRVTDGACIHTLTGHTGGIFSLAFTQDGELLASGSDDHTIKLWQMQDGTCLRTFTGHTKVVTELAFSMDGKVLATASRDNSVKLWRVADGACLRTFAGKDDDEVGSIALSPDGKLLAVYRTHVQLWRTADGSLVNTITAPPVGMVTSLIFPPQNGVLVIGGTGGIACYNITD